MDTIEKTDKYIFNTYGRIKRVFVKGEGSTLWDEEGNQYTDFLAGIAVCSLGHSHPRITEAVARQAATLVHVSNLYYTQPQAELAKLLVENSFADRVFFANSGAEANEAAIKLSRRYFNSNETLHKAPGSKQESEEGVSGNKNKRYKIVSMKQSFHGRTMATLTATGQDKIKQGFSPLMDGFIQIPFNDLDALQSVIDDTVCAVIMEPLQGEGGVVPADPEYLKAVRTLCDEKGILLIFDEVQTGMGRCGYLFAHEIYGVTPDIMTLAKALANGLPMGAMLATEKVAKGFAPGSHATTFGGTPLVASAALEVFSIVSAPEFLSECREKGNYFRKRLNLLKEKHSCIKDVRGEGLLVGMVLENEASDIVEKCLKKGFIINAIQGNILRFAPPLIITVEEIDALVDALDMLL
ncbi:Acetylornithine aminotransferase [Desulfamplus magnetovallimortis]|uniref:Acetylornithine aminotransferase n=1 Tax=Desulfamplus magnetovallimortis TaxID=1246637 RepID=A0A1W1HCW5_9BACT|nr:acetylornithine transaminase [Desulfamplus magnetovallimortis]SLM30337.1 Acetylornithine aminotransferase [Desulfamplus magnetovallimortis]